MKALVLGGTGLIGRYLVPRLLGAAYEVDVVTRNPSAASLPGGARAVAADIGRGDWLAAARPEAYDLVYHLAYSSLADEDTNRRVTVDSVRSLVERLRASRPAATRHLVYVGSMVVFGRAPADEIVTEASARAGDTPYAADKAAATQAALSVVPGVLHTVIHPTGVYDEQSDRIRFYRALLAHNYIPLRSGGQGWNNIVHADDVAAALVQCLARPAVRPAEEYIVNAETIRFGEWLARLASTVPGRAWLRLPGFTRRFCRGPVRRALNAGGIGCPLYIPEYKLSAFEQQSRYSSAKAAAHFGFAPRIRFADVCARLQGDARAAA